MPLHDGHAGADAAAFLVELDLAEKGRRVGAGMTIVQWQSGVPVTVFPPELALAQPFWPKT